MEHSRNSEADSRLALQEISRILRKPKFHYRVHSRLPLDPILSHLNPHTQFISLLFFLVLSSYIHPSFPSGLFP